MVGDIVPPLPQGIIAIVGVLIDAEMNSVSILANINRKPFVIFLVPKLQLHCH